MTASVVQNAAVATPGQQFSLSQFVTVTPGNLPEYLVLTGLDLNRYTAASNGAVGTLTGTGNSASFIANAHTDGAANIGIVFTYNGAGYANATYGSLTALAFTASTDATRSEYLALYGYGTAGVADNAKNVQLTSLSNSATGNTALQFIAAPPSGGSFLGSIDVVTGRNTADATPNSATPTEIAAIATGFVGKTWNTDGCWVLTSNIATDAGASLPISSGVPTNLAPPVGNGEWIVAYDGTKATASQQLTWQTQLRTGDIVDFAGFCGSHILTVVSGAGYGAMVVDNTGASANDGADDIVIAGPHGQSDAFNAVLPQYVVIYRLDTPVVTAVAPMALQPGQSAAIATVFTALDPAGKPIVSYQLYDTATGSFTVAGVTSAAHASDSALTVSADMLAATTFTAGSSAGSDSVVVRAFNGAYWGDWQSLDVRIGSGIAAPVVHIATDQTVLRAGTSISLSSLVTADSPASPIASYTITDPASGSFGSGHIVLNGAVNLLGTPVNTTQNMTYQVSAADFAKLTYIGGGFNQNGEALTITATNAAQQTSLPVDLPILSVGLNLSGISHYLAPGSVIAAAQLFSLSGVDSRFPIQFYQFAVDPSQGDKINLNGATNLYTASPSVAAPFVVYLIAPTDLSKVTFTAGATSLATGDDIIISTGDGVSTANANSLEHAATAAPQIAAGPGTAVIGDTIALTSLFHTTQVAPITALHIFDPLDGGTVNLNGATNLLGKQAQPGEYFVAGSDIAKVTYTGGAGAEDLLVAASSDNGTTFSPELAVHVTGVVGALAAAGMSARVQSSPVGVTDGTANVAANLDALQSLAANGGLSSITLSDSGRPTLAVTVAQASNDAAALRDIASPYSLSVSGTIADLQGSGIDIANAPFNPGATQLAYNGQTLSLSEGSASQAVLTLSGGGLATLALANFYLAADGGGGTQVKETGAAFTILDVSAGTQLTTSLGSSGPSALAYLQRQFIATGPDNVSIAADIPNVFLHGGSGGGSALTAYAGQNVLDGGSGSNFLVGVAASAANPIGADTFFVDGRGPAAVWSAVANFHKGDTVTMWGVDATAGLITDASNGAPGATGFTIHADTQHNGTYSTSLTLVGVTQQQVSESLGTVGGTPFLSIAWAG